MFCRFDPIIRPQDMVLGSPRPRKDRPASNRMATPTVRVAETISGVQASDEPGHGLILRAPSSGRFYRRPAPDKPPFIAVGDVIDEGKVIGLLEVMKTFTRIAYGGGDLPKRAKVTALHAADEADVAAGEALIGVEPAE